MTATLERPRILTTNEKWGSQQAPSDDGGAWVIEDEIGNVLCVCSNRKAAEAAFYEKAAEYGGESSDWEISVWAIHDQWPPTGD